MKRRSILKGIAAGGAAAVVGSASVSAERPDTDDEALRIQFNDGRSALSISDHCYVEDCDDCPADCDECACMG